MKDRWLKAAFRDDKIVADLLILLRQSPSNCPSPSKLPPLPPPPPPPFQLLLPPVSWGQKQPRSTPVRKYSTTTSTPTRCSPTTPLSWTTTSPTHDESSVSCTPSDPSSTSRSKNFSKLKEEETELLKERVNLKRELESIHVNLAEQRNKSDSLKRIKFDLNEQSLESGVLSTEPEVRFSNHRIQMEASTANGHQSFLPRLAIKEEHPLAKSCGMQEVAESNKGGFVLPDLNMPVGDDEIAAELW